MLRGKATHDDKSYLLTATLPSGHFVCDLRNPVWQAGNPAGLDGQSMIHQQSVMFTRCGARQSHCLLNCFFEERTLRRTRTFLSLVSVPHLITLMRAYGSSS